MCRVDACSEEPDAESGSVRMSRLVGPVIGLGIYVSGEHARPTPKTSGQDREAENTRHRKPKTPGQGNQEYPAQETENIPSGAGDRECPAQEIENTRSG